MYVQVDVNDITIEIRCGECGSIMHILDQYEFNDVFTVDVSPCDECKEEE